MSGYYLYEPSMANVGTYDLLPIPKSCIGDKYFVETVNRVFEYQDDNNAKTNKDVIFFDQVPYNNDTMFNDIEKEVVNILNKYLDKNYCVKLHPRTSPDAKGYEGVEKMMTKQTFEMLCLNNPLLTEKVLITPFSTSVALPKTLYDKEPIVISLVKLFESRFKASNLIIGFFEKLKSTYRDGSRVYLPQTLDEFSKIIKDIKKEL